MDLGCTTEGIGRVLDRDLLLAHAEISYLDMSGSAQHHIVQLEGDAELDRF